MRQMLGAAVCLVMGFAAQGQITPDRAYFGVDRPMPMTVKVPGAVDEKAVKKPECVLKMYEAGKAEAVATASVVAGRVDIASLFPKLWTEKPRAVLMVQLEVDKKAVGPSVMLLPMVNPLRAKVDIVPGSRPKVSFEALKDEEDVYSGVRAYVEQRVVFETDMGEIEWAMRPDAAPNTCWSIMELVRGGFYTEIGFHRVVPLDREGRPFVIQIGDPTGTGSGGGGSYFDLEPSKLQHDLGVVSMARASDPDTNGSQMFFALSREGTARLDGSYTAFGVVTKGIEVVQKIARTGLVPGTDRPSVMPMLKSARLVDAPARVDGGGGVMPEVEKTAKMNNETNPER